MISGVVIYVKWICIELDEKIFFDLCWLGKVSFLSVSYYYVVVSDKILKKKIVYWGFNNGMNGWLVRVI